MGGTNVIRRKLLWPLVALIMGIAIGGSVFWGLFGPNVTLQMSEASLEHARSVHDARSKDETDEALARYTLWLMVFTGILALATIGLGGATLGLYWTGEKQIDLIEKNSVAQARDMQASIDAATKSSNAANRSAAAAEQALVSSDRAWITVEAEIIGPLVFDKDELRIMIGFDLINRGRSPATNVQFFAELCADLVEAGSQAEKIARLPTYSMLDFGVILFPDQRSSQRNIPLSMKVADFKANMVSTSEALRAADPDAEEVVSRRPAIMAGVTYRLPGDRRSRHTVILFEIEHRKDSHPGWDGREGETDLTYLRLAQNFMGGLAS
jgi:hypothetical protein